MSTRYTDRQAIRVALELALDTEEAMCESYRDHNGKVMEQESGVIIARRNIAAFRRVLDRYYGGRQPKPNGGEPVSILQLMRGGK
jgi:hypothetical protein